MKKHSILIVDDDSDDREMIRDAFLETNSDPEYIFLNNGDQLLEYLQNASNKLPAIIILDLNIPGRDGREILKEIKQHKSLHHIPVIVFTTSSSPKDRQMAYSLGSNCFITKPDTFAALVQTTACILQLWLPR